ncbi:hypothetical protein OG809_27625 [Kribbella soli]
MGDEREERFRAALDEGRKPAVFMFQPTSFEPVTPERLSEWERSVQEGFGLNTDGFERDLMLRSASWSNCGNGQICADDSDWHE